MQLRGNRDQARPTIYHEIFQQTCPFWLCSSNTLRSAINSVAFYAVKSFLQKIGSQICLSLIRFYQLFISPLFPPTCRFTPTCSQYAVDAIKRYGVGRGLYLAVRRVLRCHPFNKGGFDPID